MIHARDNLAGEHGMILMTVLLLLSLLMAVGAGAVLSVQNDLRMSANLRSGAAAFYLADAGIEWGKQRISAATTMPPILSNTIQSLSAGSFSVEFLSSTQSIPLSATVLLRSVGSAQNATQTVNARVAKTYDLADAAIVLRGNARGINFAGTLFSISGLDRALSTGALIAGSTARAGITVGSARVLEQVEGALDTVQRRNIAGDDGSGASIAASQRIAGNDIALLVNDLCAAPNAVVLTLPALGSLSITDQVWGSRPAPQLRCVTGLPGSGDSVVFAANTGGAGVLVIRDAEMVLSRNFRWDGWVIVSGSDVGFRVAGADKKQILGALVIDESGNATGSGPTTLDVQGSLEVGFSREAFNLVAPLVPVATLSASYSALPFLLKQDYWRSISP
jgi:Tfp pilus assembly protein PilX